MKSASVIAIAAFAASAQAVGGLDPTQVASVMSTALQAELSALQQVPTAAAALIPNYSAVVADLKQELTNTASFDNVVTKLAAQAPLFTAAIQAKDNFVAIGAAYASDSGLATQTVLPTVSVTATPPALNPGPGSGASLTGAPLSGVVAAAGLVAAALL